MQVSFLQSKTFSTTATILSTVLCTGIDFTAIYLIRVYHCKNHCSVSGPKKRGKAALPDAIQTSEVSVYH